MLAVMVVAARRFCAAQGSTGPEEIRGQLGLPTRLVNDLLYELAKAGMLAPWRRRMRSTRCASCPHAT